MYFRVSAAEEGVGSGDREENELSLHLKLYRGRKGAYSKGKSHLCEPLQVARIRCRVRKISKLSRSRAPEA